MDKAEIKNEAPANKKKSGIRRYAVYIGLVLIATGLSLFLTLKGHSKDIVEAFSNCDGRWIGAIVGVMLFSILIDGLVITVFMRLYTRKYYINQGIAVSMIGTFYSGITPGAKGGQVMQAYTLKKQGTQISNAASLLVMYFILYHSALIIFDIVTVIFKADLMTSMSITGHIGTWSFTIPLAPLTIIGFALNVSVIGILLLMSYSHKMHNFIMHYGVGLLAKLHILKHPDQTRESLRIQVENFKIELRRLLSNVRVTILILVLLFIGLICKFSIPWFAGMALNATSSSALTVRSFFDVCFMSSYHQMITGLFPIPGGAGVSELFFSSLFDTFYLGGASGVYMSSALLIWRSATYYIMVLLAGIVTVLYKASPKEETLNVDRKTFVTMQLETYEERKRSSDTLYETSQMSRKELQNRLKDALNIKERMEIKKKEEVKQYQLDDTDLDDNSPFVVDEDILPRSSKKRNRYSRDEGWRDFNIK
ncbi:MAG: flippase-like domain-containing protein [Bacilli bacterium]|nr:flippase-like domain-containing protein [Bacilli bacterium]